MAIEERICFAKVEGLGNDFVLIDARARPAWLTAEAAVRWCDRRRGVGADGVLTLLPPVSPGARAFMHVYNADGSEPEMCGNGLRCVVAALADGEATGAVAIDTPAGLRSGETVAPGVYRTEVGIARIGERRPDIGVPEVVEAGWSVSVGNPHLVLWTAADPRALARAHGSRLERHPASVSGVNVGFARVIRSGGAVHGPEIELVVHERGAGITQACGTGAAAAVAAGAASGRVDRAATVHLPGGACRLHLSPEPGPASAWSVRLEGPARIVFRGESVEPPTGLRQRV